MNEIGRNQVLISYSHKDKDFVLLKLVSALNDNNIDTWVDSDDIEGGSNWNARIYRAIENANNVVFVISQNSIQSKYCMDELKDALLVHGKRVIPIALQHIDPKSTLPELADLQWIYFDKDEDFKDNIKKLVEAIKTDLKWKDAHSNLIDHIEEWKQKKEDPSYLLKGKEIEEYEGWLSMIGPETYPRWTEEQRKFVLESRKHASRSSRKRLIYVSIALVLVVGLAIVAFILRGVAANEADMRATAQANAETQRNIAENEADMRATAQANAETQRNIAENEAYMRATAQVIAETQRDLAFSRQLAAQARVLMTDQLDLGLLLSVEASRGSSDGLLSLSDFLQSEPHLVRIVSGPAGYIWYYDLGGGFIERLAISPDGNQLVAKPDIGDPAAMFWDLKTGQSQPLDAGKFQEYLNDWNSQKISAPKLKGLIHKLDLSRLTGEPAVASNRAAFPACRTTPSAGGAPSCASLIYIFEPESDPLITSLASCTPTAAPSDFKVKLKGGLFRISGPQTTELYSVKLDNEASNVGSQLTGVLYDPQRNWLVTAAAVQRHDSRLALIVWDLNEKKQVLEYITELWGSKSVNLNFSNAGTTMDVCSGDGGIQVDLNPDSWQAKACARAGRNLTAIEWKQFFGDIPYRKICPQWPSANIK